MTRYVHCNRAFKGDIVDIRSYVIDKVKRDKGILCITCTGFEGQMTLNHNEIDDKIVSTSAPIQSRVFLKNKYKLISFKYVKD